MRSERVTLTRTAVLESDCGLLIEQVETVIGVIAESFALSFPPTTLDEVVKLEELVHGRQLDRGLYKSPPLFISAAFEFAMPSDEPGLLVKTAPRCSITCPLS